MGCKTQEFGGWGQHGPISRRVGCGFEDSKFKSQARLSVKIIFVDELYSAETGYAQLGRRCCNAFAK